MIKNLIHLSCMAAMTMALGACGLATIPIEAPKDPIRIEATVVIKHEYVLVDSIAAR